MFIIKKIAHIHRTNGNTLIWYVSLSSEPNNGILEIIFKNDFRYNCCTEIIFTPFEGSKHYLSEQVSLTVINVSIYNNMY